MLRKVLYPYEYMDRWKKFDETTLPAKEAFYSSLNLENIGCEDYLHAQKVWDVFEIRKLGEYYDLYVQTNTLLLSDSFKTLEICFLKYINLILYILCLHPD